MTEFDDEFEKRVVSQLRAEIGNEELDKDVGARLFTIFATSSWRIYLLTFLIMMIFTGFFVWFAIEFYHAETAKDLFFWGLHALVSLFFTAFAEIWIWLEMNRVSVLRNIDRLSV